METQETLNESVVTIGNREPEESIGFLDLPWEQILSSHILSFLSIPDLFRLRAVSCDCRDLVNTHFCLQYHVNTSCLGDHFTSQAFHVMTKDSCNLKSLLLRGAKSWLTTDAIVGVISSNLRLEKIDLTGCLALSGPTVYSIGVNCENLKHLSLKDCVWISGENFLSFICNHRDLEYLDLSGCWNLDDELLVDLVQHMPSLKHLLLANLYGLTDRTIVAVSHSCANLIHLSIRGCWRVSDDSIKLLSQYCKKLKAIQVKECRNITEKSLSYLRERKVRIDKPAPPSLSHKLEQQFSNSHRINMVH